MILLLLSPLFFVLLLPFFERLRGQIALKRFKRHLTARGFKLTVAEFRSPRAQGENGAPAFLQAAQRLPSGSTLVTNPPPRMALLSSGHAVVGFREEEWVEYEFTNRWSEMARELKQNEQPLQLIRAALAKPNFDNNVDLKAGPNVRFVHLSAAKPASLWLAVQAQLCLHEGRNKEALDNLIAESSIPRFLETDRILISELVRIAVAAIARTTVWESLQADGWSDTNLAQLAQIWQVTTFAPNIIQDLEGELIFGLGEYDLMRSSNSNAVNSIFGLQFLGLADSQLPWWERTMRLAPGGEKFVDFIKEQLYCRLWRFAWLDQDELHYLRFMEGLIDLAHQAQSEKSLAHMDGPLEALLIPAVRSSFYNDLRYPQVVSFGILANAFKKSMKAETERSIVLAAIGLKRYTLRSGKFPTDLQALVPEILASIPIDYMNGEPIKYRLESDGAFVLYSVGDDLKDDGGDASLPSKKSGSGNLWNRRDFVWPQPASVEETETFRREKRAGK
jgi:hypothetical protein